jgi:two-component system cell cycle response regulator
MEAENRVVELNKEVAGLMEANLSRKQRVLMVDDDSTTRAMLEETLAKNGYEVSGVSDGDRALALIKEFRPSVVLLDLVMPGIDGLEVCAKIREMDLDWRPSIIIVSGKNDKGSMVEALSKGADDFIVKPFDEAELIARVRAHARISGFCKEVEEDRKNLELILNISNDLSASLNPVEVLKTIVNEVASATEAIRCSIVLISKEHDGYVIATNDNPDINDLKLDLTKYPEILKVVSTKSPLVVEDIVNNPLMSGVKDKIQGLKDMSLLLVPIVIADEVLGTLFLRTRIKEEGFSKKEVDFCRIVANASFHAIKNAKLFDDVIKERESLKRIAVTDALTTLYNHDFFYTRLAEEFDRAIRYRTPLSLIMMDIDDFKQVNDRYGHRVGDGVLKEVAAMLKKGVRKTDIVARYGGEEFAVILPQTDLSGALEKAKRLKELVAGNIYSGLEGGHITMSIGVVGYPEIGVTTSGDFVNRADDALYKAKRGGKNCIKVAELHTK